MSVVHSVRASDNKFVDRSVIAKSYPSCRDPFTIDNLEIPITSASCNSALDNPLFGFDSGSKACTPSSENAWM